MMGWYRAWLLVLLPLMACAPPAVLREPPRIASMPEPRPGQPMPVSTLAEPTGERDITLPERQDAAPSRTAPP
jgi:hypothetical protein